MISGRKSEHAMYAIDQVYAQLFVTNTTATRAVATIVPFL
jgi:hypothetical protein